MDIACHLNVVVEGLGSPRLGEALDALADAGYTRVVLPPVDPDAVDAVALRRTLAERGLVGIPIVGQAPDADVSSPDDRVRAAGADVLRRMVRFTADLGGDQLNGVPYGLFGRAATVTDRAAFERSAAEVGAVAELAAGEGVRMTFEVLNRYETAMLNTAEQARDYVALAGSGNLLVHLDTFHMAVEEPSAADAIRATVPQLGYLELGQSGRGPLASGSVDVVGLLRAAWEGGYRGPFGVEAFSRGILGPVAGDVLAIWRDPYDDGIALARDAIALIRTALPA